MKLTTRVSGALLSGTLLLAPTLAGAQSMELHGPAHSASVASGHATTSVVLPGVALREGVTADLHLTVFVDRRDDPCDRTTFAVHGMLHAAAAWEPLAGALFEQTASSQRPCRVIALDLPGHGRSPLPTGALFGELVFDDYVTAVLSTLDRLRDIGVRPSAIVGHSLGGAMIQFAQQRLAIAGTNLRRAYGVKDAVLLGSAIPEPIPVPGGSLAALAQFITFTPELGGHVAVPAPVWRVFFFSDLSRQLAPGAPTAEEIVAHGYSSVESLALIQGLTPRAFIEAGVFGPAARTTLTLVAYEQDPIIRPESSQALYVHLTGDASAERFVVVEGPASVHNIHMSAPTLLLQAMTDLATAR
jgi:pimeloyl-ACP methyl ester carboxylesterase